MTWESLHTVWCLKKVIVQRKIMCESGVKSRKLWKWSDYKICHNWDFSKTCILKTFHRVKISPTLNMILCTGINKLYNNFIFSPIIAKGMFELSWSQAQKKICYFFVGKQIGAQIWINNTEIFSGTLKIAPEYVEKYK